MCSTPRLTQMRQPRLILGLSLVVMGCVTPQPSAPHPRLGQIPHWPAPLLASSRSPSDCLQAPFASLTQASLPTVVEFWSPHCAPCRERLLELQARRDTLRAEGLCVLRVAVLEEDESSRDVETALNAWGVSGPSLTISQEQAVALGVHGLPSLWLVSARQRLTWVAPPRATFGDILTAAEHFR